MELFDAACCTSDAPAHQHIELQAAASAEPGEPGDIECLEERDHGHGRVHPHLECVGTGRFFRIYFFHHVAYFTLNKSKVKSAVKLRIEL